MTFSAKLNAEGDIEDYKINKTICTNVYKANYEDVDSVLNLYESKASSGVLGFDDKRVKDLGLLYEMAKLRKEYLRWI